MYIYMLVISSIFWIVLIYYLPETQGKRVDEILEQYKEYSAIIKEEEEEENFEEETFEAFSETETETEDGEDERSKLLKRKRTTSFYLNEPSQLTYLS